MMGINKIGGDFDMAGITYTPIGIIKSPFDEPKGTPIQPKGAMDVEGEIELYPEFQDGLKDIEGFSHLILIYHFHLAASGDLKRTPFMDDEEHGIFAIRAPSRPNPIGLSIVRLVEVKDNVVSIKDVDIVNGTPLLDIKPSVQEFDVRTDTQLGWLEKNIHKVDYSKDDGRFTN